MADEKRLQVSKTIEAPAEQIFALLADPGRHTELDGAGMLRGLADPAAPVSAVGDAFVMNMYNEMVGAYRMRNEVVAYERDREIGWAPAITPPGALADKVGDVDLSGHHYHWALEPTADGHTQVTHTYDWSGVADQNALPFYPVLSSEQLAGTLDRIAAAVR